jgi:hypothetical protein
VAIHVGVGGRDAMEKVDSLWVQIEEAAIEGKAHIPAPFDWGSSKSGFRNTGMAFSSAI